LLCGSEGLIREWKITSSKESDDTFPIRSAISPAKATNSNPTSSNGRLSRNSHNLLSLQFGSPNAIFVATAGGLYQAIDYNTQTLFWETSLLAHSTSHNDDSNQHLSNSSGNAGVVSDILVRGKPNGLCVIKAKDRISFFDPT
jgi:hypothetical protein